MNSGARVIPSEKRSEPVPLVYIIVLNYNSPAMTLDCLRSVLNLRYPNFRVLIVDNASTDDSVISLRNAVSKEEKVRLLVNETNEGYAGGNNRGIECALSAGADFIFILNNDTLLEPGCLAPLIEAMEADPQVGVCGGPIIHLSIGETADYGYGMDLFTGKWYLWPGAKDGRPAEVGHIGGAAMLLRSEMVRRIGMFDSRFVLVHEDTDLCFRARKNGYKVCAVPAPRVRHLGSATIKTVPSKHLFFHERNTAWLVRRHGNALHRIVYRAYSFLWRYPRLVLGYVIHHNFERIGILLRGVYAGHFRYPGPYQELSLRGDVRRNGYQALHSDRRL